MENVIECKHLTHFYGKRLIYENLNFNVPKGRILGLLGKNGTGKTTAINILSGYLQPHSGECLIYGENIRTMAHRTRQRIALLIEGHVQYTFMTIEEVERFYSAFYPAWNKDAYYELMKKLKVAPRQRISKMSCGQRSQVTLGLILAQNADLLILDDFSLGLDPGYAAFSLITCANMPKPKIKRYFLPHTSYRTWNASWMIVSSWITGRFWLSYPQRNCSGNSAATRLNPPSPESFRLTPPSFIRP